MKPQREKEITKRKKERKKVLQSVTVRKCVFDGDCVELFDQVLIANVCFIKSLNANICFVKVLYVWFSSRDKRHSCINS